MEFACEVTVRLYDTDAAGFIFSGAQFRFAHEALENFLEHVGLPIAKTIRSREVFFPVVHAEADYRAPLAVGDRLTVRVVVRALGERSFSMGYRLFLADGREAGSVMTVHASVAAATGASCPLPEQVRTAFAPYFVAGS
jgi:YbgC/YbaW family acyl-CoA thioester hydrolase